MHDNCLSVEIHGRLICHSIDGMLTISSVTAVAIFFNVKIDQRMQTQIKKQRGGTGWGFLVLIQARMAVKVCLRKRIGREGLFGRSCSLQPACKFEYSFLFIQKLQISVHY